MTPPASNAPRPSRGELAVVGLAILVIAGHQLVLSDWVVDDAAISFAYARNLVMGDGLVATPGGERIEGYSNPLWVAILALFELVGIRGMVSGKLLPLVLSGVSAVLAWRVSRDIEGRLESLAAPGLLAASATFAIWNASGLENALFTTLILAGLWAVQRESLAWAGLAFAGLALTRPEGVAYGGVVGLWIIGLHRRAAWRYWAVWAVPIAVHQAFRWAYFAWPLPNTYYAKLGASVDRTSARARGWVQLLQWSHATGFGWLLPVFVAGLWGRVLAGMVALGLAGTAIWLPDRWRIGVLLGLAVAGPAFAKGPPVLRIAAHLVGVGLAFGVYAGGDWMRGFRWMSLVIGPLAVLFASGLRVWVDSLSVWVSDREAVRWVVGIGAVGALISVNAPLTRHFSNEPVDYPEMINRRLQYTNALADRVGLDPTRVSTLDMDMGAHMLWSRYRLVDLAGLVDIPIARHTFADRDFFREYVFREQRPDFAHLHRHWARASGLVRYPEWSRTYVAVPPYDDAGRQHGGVWVRRDHLFRSPREALFTDAGLVVDAVEVVHGHVGERLRLRVGIHPDSRAEDVTVWVNEHEKRVDLAFVSREQWRGDTFVWSHPFAVGEPDSVRVEIRVGGRVVYQATPEVATGRPSTEGIVADAASGDCRRAERATEILRDLYPSSNPHPAWRAVADCWAVQAESAADPLPLLVHARSLDHRAPEVVRVAGGLAEETYSDGLAARDRGDAPVAFARFTEVLRLTPENAWARRYAEEARGR